MVMVGWLLGIFCYVWFFPIVRKTRSVDEDLLEMIPNTLPPIIMVQRKMGLSPRRTFPLQAWVIFHSNDDGRKGIDSKY